MSLPLIVATALVIFAFATAGLNRSAAVHAARNEAWSQRPGAHVRESLPLSNLDQDYVSSAPSRSFSVRLSFGVLSRTARSQSELLAGPWDDPDTHFDESTPTFVPHTELLDRMMGTGGVLSAVTGLAAVFDKITGVLEVGLGVASLVMNTLIEVAGVVLAAFGGLFEASRG